MGPKQSQAESAQCHPLTLALFNTCNMHMHMVNPGVYPKPMHAQLPCGLQQAAMESAARHGAKRGHEESEPRTQDPNQAMCVLPGVARIEKQRTNLFHAQS